MQYNSETSYNNLPLLDNNNSLKLFFNNIKEGVLLVKNNKVVFANKFLLSALGFNRQKVVNESLSSILTDSYMQIVQQYIGTVKSKTQDSANCFCEFKTHNNDLLACELFITLYSETDDIVLINCKNLGEDINKIYSEQLCSYTDEGIFLLERPEEKSEYLFAWKIKKVNKAALTILNKTEDYVLNLALKTILIPDFDYKFFSPIDNKFREDLELFILNFNQYFNFSIIGLSADRCILKIQDIDELVHTKSDLNYNLQRNELLAELLNVFNYSGIYSDKFAKILIQVAYQFKTQRILIVKDNKAEQYGEIIEQWAKSDEEKFSNNFQIDYKKMPSWQEMLEKRKMILGFFRRSLPEDIQQFVVENKMDNLYVFPLIIQNENYGSIIFENEESKEWDNAEISYLKMVSVLVSGLLNNQIKEQALLEAKNQAEESDKLKSAFLANISHDIRIPMTSIIGFSDLLVDDDLSISEREKFVELITKSGQDLLNLVDNIIDIAKIETNQIRIQKHQCKLSNLFKDLYNTHSRNLKLINHDDINLVVDFPETLKYFTFDTDLFRIKQIFDNLIDNAIKYTDKGEVRFGVNNITEKAIEFYVFDTGKGIEKEKQDVIFDRFRKSDQPYTNEYSGVGLGLSICKSLLLLMDGDMRLSSEPNKGSIFYFNLPLDVDFEDFNNKQIEKEQNYVWEGKTIMIAEDAEQSYRFLEFIFSTTKVNLIWAKNGLEAVNYIKENKNVDLILMDIIMPEMDGIEATKQIKQIVDIPIIAQTGYIMDEYNEIETILDAGCSDYITKPINVKKLLHIIDYTI